MKKINADAKYKEEGLQKSESKYRRLYESMIDAFASVDMNGRIIECNKAFTGMVGYTGEELLKLTYSDLTPSAWHKFEESILREDILKKGYSRIYEKEYRRKDGSVFPVEMRTFLLKDDNGIPTFIWAIVRDITERKKIENELILAKEKAENSENDLISLNQHLHEVRENERALIAREIHDQLGQSLTALKIDINWLQRKTRSRSEIKAKLNAMTELLTDTIKDVQRISSELRPSILDDIGLAAAMEWYCEDFSTRTGLTVNMEFENIQFENMNSNLALYRVLQESLTNIIRHANAKVARIKLSRIRNNVILLIQDNGIGIPDDKISSSKCLGLLGMFERIKYAGGRMNISKPARGGTKILVDIPFENRKL